jgi:MFS family permease
MVESDGTPAQSPKAPTRRAWRVVLIFSLLYVISAVDRLILAVLAPALKATYHLDNASLGALIGLAFAALYVLAGLPVGRVIDLGPRKGVVVLGVLVWSGATAVSAFAPNFFALLACRAFVAVGEAVLTPAALSMIGDLFQPSERTRPTAVFVSTGAVAGMSAAALGGEILAIAQALSKPVGLAPWRVTLVLLGVLGIFGAMAFALLVREPSRTLETPLRHTPGSPQAMYWRLYLLLFSAVGFAAMLSYSLVAWTPTILIDHFGLQGPAAGLLVGGVGAASGLLGMTLTPWAIGRRGRGGGADAVFRVGVGLVGIALMGLAVMAAARTSAITALSLALMLGALSSLTLLPSLLIQTLGPPLMRGRLIAVYLLIANLLGLGVGPALTGLMADRLFTGPARLTHALVALGAADLIVALVLLTIARSRRSRTAALA